MSGQELPFLPTRDGDVVVYGLDEQEWRALEREVVDLFTALLRVDTTNRQRDRGRAEVLRAYLDEQGLRVPHGGRAAAPAEPRHPAGRQPARAHPHLPRTHGRGAGRRRRVERPAVRRRRADGYVWGFGATDMKNQLAAEAVAVARLARSGADVRRDRQARGDGRRGGRHLLRRALALPQPPRPSAPPTTSQRGHGRPLAARRRPPRLPARLRREGVRPVPHPHARARRARVGAREGTQRRHRPGARRHGARPRRPAGRRLAHDGRASSTPSWPTPRWRARLKDPVTARAAGAELRRPTLRWRASWSRCSAPRSRPPCSTQDRWSTSSPRTPRPASTAASSRR